MILKAYFTPLYGKRIGSYPYRSWVKEVVHAREDDSLLQINSWDCGKDHSLLIHAFCLRCSQFPKSILVYLKSRSYFCANFHLIGDPFRPIYFPVFKQLLPFEPFLASLATQPSKNYVGTSPTRIQLVINRLILGSSSEKKFIFASLLLSFPQWLPFVWNIKLF